MIIYKEEGTERREGQRLGSEFIPYSLNYASTKDLVYSLN